MTTLAILLATYNGSKHIAEQLDSILAQSYSDFTLIIRDDGSSDATYDILERYAKRDRRIRLLPRDENLGVIANFSHLLGQTEAGYILFSDQDDIWLPTKALRTLTELQQMEQRYGVETPCLAHTDLQVVGANLEPIHPSFWRYAKLLRTARHPTFKRLLTQHLVTGCACGINRALAKAAYPIPTSARMHDHWLSLVAAALGKIESIREPLILYRQHGGNQLGAHAFYSKRLFRKLFNRAEIESRLIEQARAMPAVRLNDADRRALEAYCSLNKTSVLKRYYRLVRYRLFKEGWHRNAVLLLTLPFLRPI